MPIYKTDKGYRVQVNYTDSFGNKKVIVKQNKNTQTLKQAKQVEAEILLKVKSGSGLDDNITLDELFEYHLKSAVNDTKKSSVATKIKRYENHVKPYFGHRKINSLTVIDFQNWKNDLLATGLSIAHLQGIYACLHALLNYAVKYDFLVKNHLSKLGNFKNPNATIKEYNVWDVADFEKFAEEVKKTCIEYEENKNEDYLLQWGYYVMYNILFYCGCRKGEVYPLTWNDIDFDNRILKIRRNLIYKIEKGTFLITTPKTKNSIRDIPLPQRLIDVLNEHRMRYNDVYGFTEEFYVCGGVAPLTDTKLADLCKECAKRAGVKQVTIHGLRHSHASVLLKNKVNVLAVSKRLGHSSVRETMETYAHLFKETEFEVADLIDAL